MTATNSLASAVTNTSTKSAPALAAKRAIVPVLMSLRRQTSGDAAYYRQAFRVVAQHFDTLLGTLEVRCGVSTIDETFRASEISGEQLATLVEAMSLDAASDNRARSRVERQANGGQIGIISHPLHDADSGQTVGAVVLVMNAETERAAKEKLHELGWLLNLVAANKPIPTATGSADDKRLINMQRALERAARCSSLTELAFQITNSLSERLQCVHVALGLVRQKQIEVLAISGLERVVQKSSGVAQMRQAMEEAFDAKQAILAQQPINDAPAGEPGRILHQQWRRAVNGDAVFSIPLLLANNVIAVVSLRRTAQQPFTETELKSIPTMLEPFAPAIALLQVASRPWMEQFRHALRTRWTPWLSEKPIRQRLAAIMAVVTAVWFVFGSLPYHVASSSLVAPAQKHHVVAPFPGRVGEVLVRAGDRVQAGQPLMQLDTRELILEKQKLVAELASARIDVDRALGAKDATAAFVAKSQLDAIDVQLSVARDRLERAQIVAPVDGLVMSGDPHQRLGQAVDLGDALLEIASDGGQFIELHVSEKAVVHLHEGQTGNFVSAAQPNVSTPCHIRRIYPAARVVNGRNVFVVEAELPERPTWLRVGMEGYARIDVGHRPVWWIVLHSAIDAVRRELWL